MPEEPEEFTARQKEYLSLLREAVHAHLALADCNSEKFSDQRTAIGIYVDLCRKEGIPEEIISGELGSLAHGFPHQE